MTHAPQDCPNGAPKLTPPMRDSRINECPPSTPRGVPAEFARLHVTVHRRPDHCSCGARYVPRGATNHLPVDAIEEIRTTRMRQHREHEWRLVQRNLAEPATDKKEETMPHVPVRKVVPHETALKQAAQNAAFAHHATDMRDGFCACGAAIVESQDQIFEAGTNRYEFLADALRQHVGQEAIKLFTQYAGITPERTVEHGSRAVWPTRTPGAAPGSQAKTVTKRIAELNHDDIGFPILIKVEGFDPVGGVLKRIEHATVGDTTKSLLTIGQSDYHLHAEAKVVVIDSREVF